MLTDRRAAYAAAREDAHATSPLPRDHALAADDGDLLAGAGFWLLGGASLLAWTAVSLLLTSA